MNKTTAFIVAGTLLGLFAGSSMGIATGGTAYNAAIFLGPLGGFVGWLLANKNRAIEDIAVELPADVDLISTSINTSNSTKKSDSSFATVVISALAILAAVWNFQIDLLKYAGLLPTFMKQPLLFAGLCVLVSAIFPPFFAVYFFAWLAASYFGLHEENNYRVVVK